MIGLVAVRPLPDCPREREPPMGVRVPRRSLRGSANPNGECESRGAARFTGSASPPAVVAGEREPQWAEARECWGEGIWNALDG